MNTKKERGKIDWMITLVPLAIVIALCVLFFFAPEQSNTVLSQIRFFFGDTFGTYYLVIGLGIFILSLYIAGSKYGNIVLGEQNEKPKYSFFAWGSMMFTCGLAADILFYSFSEWVLYATDPHLAEMGSIQDWAGVYPLFHWSFIPWGFYLVLAVAFGFMLHVRKRNRQKYSEACRPILGKYTDGWAGRIIDLLAVFALLAGTATTFSVATPLMATIISELFHVAVSRTVINIIILLITCAVYTYSLLHGFKGISKLANICIYMFFGLIAFVLLFGGETRYIIETGFSSLGRMIQNFVDLSTFTDPLRTSNFPQNWTIYYWAYWMVWCVAAPFFIGSISRGRTVRQTILGGYVFGVGSTLTSFIVLGNYSMGMQVTGKADFIAQYTDCLEKLMSARSKIEGKIGYLASSIIGPDSEPMNVPAIDMRPAKNGYPHWYKYLSEGIVQISRATFVSILVSYDAIKKCGLPCKDYFIWGDDSEYTMRISKYYAPAYFVGASVALHKRFNAKKLDIMMENDTKRLEMFRKYYRNTTINEGLFVSQKQRKKLVIHNFKVALQKFLKGDFIRAKVIFLGTLDSITQRKKFEEYIEKQLSNR